MRFLKMTICLAMLLLAPFLISTANARIIRTITVDDDGPADFNNIQAAIDNARDNDTVEIKPGTYTGLGNYNIRFNGKAITVRGTYPDDFDIVAETVIDCNSQGRGFIFESGEDANSILTGITVTNAYNDRSDYYGGGVGCEDSSPAISKCIIEDNSGVFGGGIGTRWGDLTIGNCIIRRNHASQGGGIFGSGTMLTIENCLITANTVSNRGGGIRSSGLFREIRNCIIAGNKADDAGGAVAVLAGETLVTRCTITGNTAANAGGALSVAHDSHSLIDNSILWNNDAPSGPEIALLFESYINSSASVAHSNVQGSQAMVFVDETCTLNWATGNINADPCFADPGRWYTNDTPDDTADDLWVPGDYHLKSQAGRWGSNSKNWDVDPITSLCIDAGDLDAPIGPEPFPNGGTTNIGAYGGTLEASKSYFGKPPCDTIVAADINGDCVIDARDFAFLAGHWLADGLLPVPEQAANPDPQDTAVGVDIDPVLTWETGSNAESHDVYFGAIRPGIFLGNQTETTFDPGTLEHDTTYYWRIDEQNRNGTAQGAVWSFTTVKTKGRGCFPADTLVWADGEMVEISKVAAGAMVDKPAVAPVITDLHEKVCAHQVEDIDVHIESDSWDRHDIVFENGNTLAVAYSHYFLLDTGKWARVEKLAPGTKLSTLEGSVTIKTIKKTKSAGTVYNLKIKDSDRYLVGKDGVIVRDW